MLFHILQEGILKFQDSFKGNIHQIPVGHHIQNENLMCYRHGLVLRLLENLHDSLSVLQPGQRILI